MIQLTNTYSLMHRIKWSKYATYAQIASLYSDFVLSKYGDAIVIFDGYNSKPSTKDTTRLRRASKSMSRQINFTEEMNCNVSKEDFLANLSNKTRIIQN